MSPLLILKNVGQLFRVARRATDGDQENITKNRALQPMSRLVVTDFKGTLTYWPQ